MRSPDPSLRTNFFNIEAQGRLFGTVRNPLGFVTRDKIGYYPSTQVIYRISDVVFINTLLKRLIPSLNKSTIVKSLLKGCSFNDNFL